MECLGKLSRGPGALQREVHYILAHWMWVALNACWMWVVFNEHQFSSPANTTHTQWLQTYIIDPNSRIECELYSRWTELVSIEWVYWIGVHWIQLTFCTLIQWIPTQFTFERIQLTFSTLIQWTPIQFTFKYNSHSSGIPIFQMSCIWSWNIWIGVHLNVSGIEGKNQVTFLMLAFPQLSSWGFRHGRASGAQTKPIREENIRTCFLEPNLRWKRVKPVKSRGSSW